MKAKKSIPPLRFVVSSPNQVVVGVAKEILNTSYFGRFIVDEKNALSINLPVGGGMMRALLTVCSDAWFRTNMDSFFRNSARRAGALVFINVFPAALFSQDLGILDLKRKFDDKIQKIFTQTYACLESVKGFFEFFPFSGFIAEKLFYSFQSVKLPCVKAEAFISDLSSFITYDYYQNMIFVERDFLLFKTRLKAPIVAQAAVAIANSVNFGMARKISSEAWETALIRVFAAIKNIVAEVRTQTSLRELLLGPFP